ncbi:intraflagellar transport protein 43 homolog B isoform X2 [Prorops nasuta]|uniref:intraflagellar transport protein 43 homolog B isoform X2 n=1 Tax=Prorops nasuta TaxID=863751 RepID=UPI0034CFC1D7
MDWANDLEITSKKLIPRLGRRAAQNNIQEESKSDDDLLDSPVSVSSGKLNVIQNPPVVPPRARKTGWGDELKSGRIRAASSAIEQDRFRTTDKQEYDNDITVIPDLDEIQEDNLSVDISNAPALSANRVTAYKEVDTDLVKNAAFASLEGLSLSLLTEKLYPESLIKEPDEVWNWNILFTQVSSDINSETQKRVDSNIISIRL